MGHSSRVTRVRTLFAVLLVSTLLMSPAPSSPDAARAQGAGGVPDSALPPVPPADGPTTVERRRGRTVAVRTTETQPAPDGRPAAPGRLIVRFRPGADAPARERAHRAAGAVASERLALPNTSLIQVEPAAVGRALAAYRARSDVASAEPDYLRRATDIPNDPRLGEQYGVGRIGAPTAWDRSKSTPSVRIAILDTGVYSASSTWEGPDGRGHRDVRDKVVAEANFTTSANGADDNYDHGTLMAGVAAAATNNGAGVAGIGYDATLLNVKVLGDDGSGFDSWIVQGIVWAADNGAKVISMSLGGDGPCTRVYQDAIDYAWNKGAVVVAAAGNGGDDGVGDPRAEAPASCQRVLAVAATDRNDARAGFSNYGPGVDLAAPGVDIVSTDYLGQYSRVSGTSPATPHVAGVAALLWATEYGTSPQAVVDRLTSTASRVGGTGDLWAYGRVDAAAALAGADVASQPPATSTPGPTTAPTATPTAPPTLTPTATPTVTTTPTSVPTTATPTSAPPPPNLVAPIACSPRPRVDVTTTVGNGTLTATLTATGPGNLIRSVRIGAEGRPPANAVLDIAGGPSGVRAATTFAPSQPTSRVQLIIRRAIAGQPTTVPIVVEDACGPWETFVGGGAGAGF